MDYKIRFATPDDYDLIYALKTESIRPYVEKIWGWDEDYQKKDFDGDFSIPTSPTVTYLRTTPCGVSSAVCF